MIIKRRLSDDKTSQENHHNLTASRSKKSIQ